MTTLEMLNDAQKTNRTYIGGSNFLSIRYSVSKGFHDEDGESWNGDGFPYDVNDIFCIDVWQLLEPKKMTLEQIENELGYEIELISNS